MKNVIKILVFLCCLFIHAALANSAVMHLYNWSSYMPDDVIRDFEKETGIKVSYSTYDSNETMYAKLKAHPDAGYDLVVPSTYFIDRMRRQGMLQKIDKSKLSHFNNLNPELMGKNFDPTNEYSIPYFWGTTGIAVNTKYHQKDKIKSWADLWNPRYKDQILIVDDTREIFSMAMITLGYSVNDTNPEHIKQAYLKLRALLPNVKLFNSEAEQAIYIDEDATLGMGWSGDIYMARKENENIHFIFPDEGFVVWLDSLAIPVGAKHVENAYKFINFLLRPDIAKRIAIATGYASANSAAVKLMPKQLKENPIIYPSPEVLKRGQYQNDVGDLVSVYERYMELLKIGS